MPHPRLLTDAEVQRFIAHGFLCLKTELPARYHQRIYDRVDALTAAQPPRGPGNNLPAMIPELSALFEDPVVTGALTSVLGPGYLMLPHRALHNNPPGSEAQRCHKDSYWGYTQRVRNHRSRWAMIMYVPQDTPAERGPTGVIPGSQYQTQRPDETQMQEVAAALPEGGFLLIHYDIWHRKLKNLTPHKRYMMKFEFVRMHEPMAPTWEHVDPAWTLQDTPTIDLQPLWQRQWAWLRHAADRPAASRDEPQGMAATLRAGKEPAAIAASYRLAAFGAAAVPLLLDAIGEDDGDEIPANRSSVDGSEADWGAVARNAAHGLVEIGTAAVPGLLDLLTGGRTRARMLAAFALGEIREGDDAVIAALARATRDPNAAVRISAVEALGLKQGRRDAVPALAKALHDPDAHVRFSAALSLAQQGPAAAEAVPDLEAALSDDNRYVPGYAVEALERVDSPDAWRALMPFLKRSRWCPYTTPTSTY
jgi:HEAT repeat protein